MHKQIFVNLPVKDLQQSIKFYTSIGYTFNPHFTDETATCMVINDTIFVMLLTEAKFKGFSPNPIADAHKTTEVLLAVNCDTREDVDSVVEKAKAAGGREFKDPQDHGFMYTKSYQDLDGHVWEVFWMDPAQIPA